MRREAEHDEAGANRDAPSERRSARDRVRSGRRRLAPPGGCGRTPSPRSTRIPAVEVNAERAIKRPQLDELVCRDGDRAKGRARADELDVATNPYRLAPPAQDLPGRRLDADEAIEWLVPLVAPDLQIDVDDVVVRDRDAAQRVRDREGTRLIARVEVPDDPCAVTTLFDTERCRWPGSRLECGLVAPLERDAALGDRGVDQCLAVAQRMSRYPNVKSPENATSIRSLTPSEPSSWTSTATSAESSEKLSAEAVPGRASAAQAARARQQTRRRSDSGREADAFRDLRANGNSALADFRSCTLKSRRPGRPVVLRPRPRRTRVS